jgi:hypothetical protein
VGSILIGTTARSLGALVAILLLWGGTAVADISGHVREDGTDLPITGARVHLQADPSSPVVVTGADGAFTLVVNPVGMVMVTAGVEYDDGAAVNFVTGGAIASDGQSDVVIYLEAIPPTDDPDYQNFLPRIDDCGNCHEEQRLQWLESNHSSAGTDEWVRDLYSGDGTPGGSAGYIFIDTHDPGETGFCATCHTALEDVFDPGNVMFNQVTSAAALEGVSCIACHQMDSVNADVGELHHLGNSSYRFPDGGPFIPTSEYVWGPLDDIEFGGMRAAYAPLFAQSLVCAGCHEYNRPGTQVPGQTPYTEWLSSPYAVPGPDFMSCQDCHMPEEDEDGYLVDPIGNPPLRPAEQRHRHEFEGATAARLEEYTELTTTLEEGEARVAVRCEVSNSAGHSFPTGVSVRNALLVIAATWNDQPLVQLSGPTVPFWADDNVPGQQEGDYAGEPGNGFARVLEGRINDQGPIVRPVLFIDGESVYSATQIPSGGSAVTEVEFGLPGGAQPGDIVSVEARLIYRRAWRAVAVTKGWETTPQGGPIEIEVHSTLDTLELTQGGAGVAIPVSGPVGTAALAIGVALGALFLLRRRHLTV